MNTGNRMSPSLKLRAQHFTQNSYLLVSIYDYIAPIITSWMNPIVPVHTCDVFSGNKTHTFIYLLFWSLFLFGYAVPQVICRWPVAAEARVRSQIRSCGICGGHSGAETGFSPSTSIFSVCIFSPMLLTHLPEGQAGEVWVPFKHQCFVRNPKDFSP